jgi:3-oxoacyl-[acyl-carrier-protein] synthase II
VELIIALRAIREGVVPPTVGLENADPDAEGWVSDSARRLGGKRSALMTNSGFSGINTALVLTGQAL